MYSFKVLLASKDGVKKFVHAAEEMDYDIDIGSGNCLVDAKSIVGVIGLDISKPLSVRLHTDQQSEIDGLINNIKEILV